MQSGFVDALTSIHDAFTKTTGEKCTQAILERLQTLLPRLLDAIHTGSNPSQLAAACVEKVRQIQIVSSRLVLGESESAEIEKHVKEQAHLFSPQEYIRIQSKKFGLDLDCSGGCDTPKHGSTEDDESLAHYRSYFLEHLSWPNPSPSERSRLLARVSKHGRPQLSNWFVNSRRRSGWAALARRFGGGTKEGMEALLNRVEVGESSGEELELVNMVRKDFEADGSSVIRPDLGVLVDEIESQIRTESLGERKRKFTGEDDEPDVDHSRKRPWNNSRSSSSGSSSSVESQTTLRSSPTFRSSSTLDSSQTELFQPRQLPRGLKALGSPGASSEYANGVPASRRCVSDSRSHTSPKRSTPPYRSVSSSFALGMESTLAGSLTMPLDPDFLATCPTASPAWNGGDSPKTSIRRFASTSPSTFGGDHSDETSLNKTTTSNTWYETLQDDRWTDLYPWLGRTGSDSLSGLDMFGQDEEVNWLMGTELVGLC